MCREVELVVSHFGASKVAIQIYSSINHQPYNAFIKNLATTSCRYRRGESDTIKKNFKIVYFSVQWRQNMYIHTQYFLILRALVRRGIAYSAEAELAADKNGLAFS